MFERVYKFEIITLGVLTLPTTRVTCSHPMNHIIQIELMPLFFLGISLYFYFNIATGLFFFIKTKFVIL